MAIRFMLVLSALFAMIAVPASSAFAQTAPPFCRFSPIGPLWLADEGRYVNYETPRFRFGFASLKSELGDIMGEPVECEHPDGGTGDTLQRTTTGLAFYRKSTNTPTFTDGFRHWGLTSGGLAYWEGDAIDPPVVRPTVAQPPSRRPDPPPPPISSSLPDLLPAPIGSSTPSTSLPTGAYIERPRYQRGLGSLTVSNGTDHDAVVKLKDANGARRTRAAVYARAYDEVTLPDIGPGNYVVQFMTGSDWDGSRRRFRTDATAFEFQDLLAFAETRTSRGTEYVDHWLTLNTVRNGNVPANWIDLATFMQD